MRKAALRSRVSVSWSGCRPDARCSSVTLNRLGGKGIDRTGLILDIFGERARTREGRCRSSWRIWNISAPAGAHLDPSGAPARRLRLPGRPGRDADRGRPPPDRRPHRAAEAGAGGGAAHARPASRRAQARALPGSGAGWLHQRRQIHAFQCAHRRRRDRAQDQLFATLDPTMRGLQLPSGRHAILSDTVGFISDLPTELVARSAPRWRRSPRLNSAACARCGAPRHRGAGGDVRAC